MDISQELTERFFRYAAVASQSDSSLMKLPSSPGQMSLALLLAEELRELGVQDVVVDDQAIVTGVRRGTRSRAPRVGFIAHLDTADIGLSPAVRPQIHRFSGSDLCLNSEQSIWLRIDEHPELRQWLNADIITSDGTSVLGADNKAAIAVIMTVLARQEDPEAHGDIFVAFVPDEEIGLRGAKALDLDRFPCDFAYTIDCCELGEVVIENFNAASAEIVFEGASAHPMSAKGKLVNPILMAHDFISHFDPMDTPEHTEGREGFCWVANLVANDSSARLQVLIRDFDNTAFEGRKTKIATVVEAVRQKYASGNIQYRIADEYRNVGPCLSMNPLPMSLLGSALDRLHIIPKFLSMRGGTDGAVLSERGIPTPNMFTGAYNFHSRFEFLPVPAFVKSFQVAALICELAADSS
ncbi:MULTISPECIES: peptidase T [unclassified Shinella]|uniref:peptidase T n=1 Tax=unclassified Shinella TaxID=2643062 RepID=UPI00234E50AC|nr:peptidase T [Shinella sp. YE25]MDC7259546.1 peptidase T [Shinella sp. YE25]